MIRDDDLLLSKLTKHIADTDFSGYTIQYPPLYAWKTLYPEDATRKIMASWDTMIQRGAGGHLGLYLHFPFCKQRCTCCRYFSLVPDGPSEIHQYILCLQKEIRFYGRTLGPAPVRTVYFGGGTPSLMSEEQINAVFSALCQYFDLSRCLQVAFEGNADFLTLKKLKRLKQWGVNRLTIGVQSLDPSVVQAIQRYQSDGAFHTCLRNARRAKIDNINVDIMVGLPVQTLQSALDTVTAVIQQRPEMIHVHPFFPTAFSVFSQGKLRLSKKAMRLREAMLDMTKKILFRHGYRPMAYDADGLCQEARNLQLVDAVEVNAPYVGLGAGAVSHATGFYRYANTTDIAAYAEALGRKLLPLAKGCRLTQHDEMIYFVTGCLRYGKLEKDRFRKLFHKDIDDIFPETLAYLKKRKKIILDQDVIISKMNRIGEFLIFSKYFYDGSLIDAYKSRLSGHVPKRLYRDDLRYTYL